MPHILSLEKGKCMIFKRQHYMELLISGMGNDLVKIITGGRRCGKSFLLFNLFYNYLKEKGVDDGHIIRIMFDDLLWEKYRDPYKLVEYVREKCVDDGETTYILLDEIQYVDNFVSVLLSFMHMDNVEIYVTGSNSRFLSKDVVTEFRGRGQEIRVWPLSFYEYYEGVGGDKYEAWQMYYTYGGLPQVAKIESEQQKREYLRNIFDVTYIRDVVERNGIKQDHVLRQLVKVLASGIGAPMNAKKISDTFKSVVNIDVRSVTISDYLKSLQDAFLIEEALRYNVKGRKYIGTETKYYFLDIGLRAAAIDFRQQEETHIMENIVYCELRSRGYLVDVGMVETWARNEEGKSKRQQLEVDFVVNRGADRVYIQSAYRMPTLEKENQERRSLLKVGDSFRKMIVVGDNIKRKVEESGIVVISLLDFLLDKKSVLPY